MPWHRKHRASLNCGNTFGVGIIDEDGKVLADIRNIYKPKVGWGIIPHEAARYHQKNKNRVLKSALEKSGLKIKNIDVLAYSCGPGLSPCLLCGATFAIKLSKKYELPLLPIHHGVGHVEIARLLTRAKDPAILFLSGGHNMILAYVEGFYKIFGETLDITYGNLADVVARKMELGTPGGSELERLAERGKYVELPLTIKGMDISFAGIQTAALNLLRRGIPKEDISYSLQETCFAMLAETAERAMAHTEKQECLVTGGVAANKRLKEMITSMCKERGAKAFFVPPKYSGDNGIQMAWAGLLAYKSGWKPDFKDKILPRWRIDEVKITWI